jgi:hypothetical protein
MWVIVKMVANSNKVKLPVIILNGQSEIWEFESEDEAANMRNIFEANSDSGHEYLIKKL